MSILRGLSRRWVGIALAVSVSLNLLVAGFAAGGMLRGERQGRGDAITLRYVMREGGPEARALARDVIAARGPEYRALRDEVGEARQRVGDAVTADPFDRATLDAALADLRAKEARIIALRHQAFADVAGGLSPDARRSLMEAFGRRAEPRR